MPSLSVVIPVYRQPRCLDLTLTSLATQQPPPGDFEVVVVDDGSGDETESVIASHQGSLPVRLVKQSVNRGRAAARNAGAAAASADRLLLMDADSCADPGLLDAHARFAQSFPDRVLLGARVESSWLSLSGQPAAPAMAARGYGRDTRLKMGLDQQTFPASGAPWIFGYSHNMSLPAADFRACGGFDENFTAWGHEDIEFAYRLYATAGRRPGYFQFDPQAVCYHVPHFRNFMHNWTQAERMLSYLTTKHASLEVEFIDEGPFSVCDLLPAYLDRLARLAATEGLVGAGQAIATLPAAAEPGRLVIGFGLAGHLPDGDLIQAIDHQPPGPTTAPGLIGLRLPYPEDRFADVVNLDLWRVLSPDHLSRLVIEGLRLSRVVHLGYSGKVTEAASAELIADPGYVCDMLSRYCEMSLHEPATDDGLLWIRAER